MTRRRRRPRPRAAASLQEAGYDEGHPPFLLAEGRPLPPGHSHRRPLPAAQPRADAAAHPVRHLDAQLLAGHRGRGIGQVDQPALRGGQPGKG